MPYGNNATGEYDCRVNGTWSQITASGWENRKEKCKNFNYCKIKNHLLVEMIKEVNLL